MCSLFFLFSLGNLFFVLVVYLILRIFCSSETFNFSFNTGPGTEHLLQLKHWHLAAVRSILYEVLFDCRLMNPSIRHSTSITLLLLWDIVSLSLAKRTDSLATTPTVSKDVKKVK